MDNSVEVSAGTVDEAVEQALLELGLSRDEVDIEILSEGTRRRFGRRPEPARVIVRALASAGQPPARGAGEPGSVVNAEAEDADEDVVRGPLAFDDPAVGKAEEILRELLRLIDIDASITARSPETPGDGLGLASAVLDVSGEDLGLLIGRRGETLAALQYMVNLLLNQGAPDPVSVTVDVESYRRRRERRLVTMARRAADEVDAMGATVTLEPMPANERRIVHLALADDRRVTTSSTGAGQSRKVAVIPRDS